jgi:hypothetical protein
MKTRLFSMLFCLCLIGVAALVGSPARPEAARAAPLQPQAASYSLLDEQIQWDASPDDITPAVAHPYWNGIYQDLVVWEDEGDPSDGYILGYYVDHGSGSDFDYLNVSFVEKDTALAPAVAYDTLNDVYLVVWVDEVCLAATCADVIRGRLMAESYLGGTDSRIGDPFNIAIDIQLSGDSADYGSPAIAFNEDEGVFAVAFTRDSQASDDLDINLYWQMVAADETQPIVLGPPEGAVVRNTVGRQYQEPSIAWSDAEADTFLITSTSRSTATGDTVVAAHYLLDTYQLSSPQVPGGWLLAPYDEGDYPLTGNCLHPSVAYDSERRAFVVVFSHEEETAAAALPAGAAPQIGVLTYTIYGQRLRPEYDSSGFVYQDGENAFPVETGGSASHDQAVIASARLANEMLVLIRSSQFSLAGTTYALNAYPLNGMAVGAALEVESVGIGGYIGKPALACERGYCLVVWSGKDTGADDLDIFGQRVAANGYCVSTAINPDSSVCQGCRLLTSGQFPLYYSRCYLLGTEAKITAQDGLDYAFSHWDGDASGSTNPLTVVMDAGKFIVGNYTLKPPITVLFDEAHEEANTIDWARAQELNPDHPDWIYYGMLVTDLSDRFTITRNASSLLTLPLLQNYDALVLAVPHSDFSAAEQQAIHDYIATGGGLMVLGDCNMLHPANAFLDTYGIGFNQGCLFSPLPEYSGDFWVTDFADHPAVTGVTAFYTNWLQSLILDAEGNSQWGAGYLAVTDADTWEDSDWSGDYNEGDNWGGMGIAAATDTDCGRVVAFADNAFQDDFYDVRGNTPLMRALLRWVGSGTSCTLEEDFQVYLPAVVR